MEENVPLKDLNKKRRKRKEEHEPENNETKTEAETKVVGGERKASSEKRKKRKDQKKRTKEADQTPDSLNNRSFWSLPCTYVQYDDSSFLFTGVLYFSKT